MNEFINPTISVHDRECIGCARHNKDIMVSVSMDGQIKDVFLSQEGAERLRDDLIECIKRNSK